MITLKSEREIKKIKEAGHIVYLALMAAGEACVPGATTKDVDKAAEDLIVAHGFNPSCKGYAEGDEIPFPACCCVSVNDEVIHGIPSDRKLVEGDVVKVDIVADKDGYFADAARTFIVGKATDPDAERLVEVTKQSFFEGLKYAKVGNRISDISHAIQEYVEKNGYSVLREFQGHGVGIAMHEDPGIPNFGKPGKGPRLEEGMVLAIEPMVCQGRKEIMESDDGWSIITEDGSLGCHYENTIAITKNGPIILTND
jgi:methionyl aminopeptidase